MAKGRFLEFQLHSKELITANEKVFVFWVHGSQKLINIHVTTIEPRMSSADRDHQTATTTMSECGENPALWLRGLVADLLIDTEESDKGGEKLLRICFVECEERREFMCFLVSCNGGMEWHRTTLNETEKKILECLPPLEDFDEIIESSWGGKEVEMDSVVVEHNEAVELLQKIVSSRNILRSETKGDEMEGKSNGGTTEKAVEEEENPSGEEILRANTGEECCDFRINTVVSVHDEREAAISLGSDQSISARSDFTEEEIKWLLRNWNFDQNPNNVSDRTAREREHLSRLGNFDSNDADDGNRPSFLNKMEEWLSFLWDYFLNGCDKVGWGQYILGRPPKKPGGTCFRNFPVSIWETHIFLFLMITSTVRAAESEHCLWPESMLSVGVRGLFLLLLAVGLVPSRKFFAKLTAGIALVCKFIDAVEAFMDRHEIDRINSSTVHSVLFDSLCRDAPLTAEGDPEERVEKFFAEIDKDILSLSSKFSYNREEIVRVYLRVKFEQHKSQDRRRKGVELSREDRVRLQYSTARIAEEVFSDFEISVRDAKSDSDAMAVSNGENSENRETDEMEEQKIETQGEGQVEQGEIQMQARGGALECARSKKEDDCTVTTAAESLGDLNGCGSVCEEKCLFAVTKGTLFEGIEGPTRRVLSCEFGCGNESCVDAEESLKERNRRLLAKERERLSQRKAKTPKQKSKHENFDEVSQTTELKKPSTAKNRVSEGTITRVEHAPRQRKISSVDRRWEHGLLSRMRNKIRIKVEKSVKPTVKRVKWWRTRYVPKVCAYDIRAYSSSAYRFAAFKSNRRYKPGD